MNNPIFDTPTCTALTHLLTPYYDRGDPDAMPPYYCCVNAGVSSAVFREQGGSCPVTCECHEKPEGWRPEN